MWFPKAFHILWLFRFCRHHYDPAFVTHDTTMTHSYTCHLFPFLLGDSTFFCVPFCCHVSSYTPLFGTSHVCGFVTSCDSSVLLLLPSALKSGPISRHERSRCFLGPLGRIFDFCKAVSPHDIFGYIFWCVWRAIRSTALCSSYLFWSIFTFFSSEYSSIFPAFFH